MERTGLQVGFGPGFASLPCLSSGGGAVVLTTHLTLSRADCSLRSQIVKLQPSGNFQSRLFNSKLSKRRRVGCSVHPRAKLEELSTAEEVGDKNGVFDEGSRVSRFSVSESAAVAEEDSAFDWLAQWYPVGVLKNMDKRQPHPATVLGRDLVLWYDRSGDQWQVFADVCPHRLAPLSEGRINEQGHLQCSYHGWSFAPSSGACTTIPQAPKDIFEGRNPKRSCATVYHSVHHQGLLWVYMDAGAKEVPAGNSPPFVAALSDPDFVFDLGMSDVMYGYEALIENLLDPAHVPFAHHGLQGNRKSARPLEFRVAKAGKTGFEGNRDGNIYQYYIAPTLATMEVKLPPPRPPKGHPWALKLREFIMSKKSGVEAPQKLLSTVFFCVPTTPEKSRLFFAFPRNFAKGVFKFTPKWLSHHVHMTVLDSDSYFLHLMYLIKADSYRQQMHAGLCQYQFFTFRQSPQERKLEEKGGMANIEKSYYTPTSSDTFVVAYRRWLKKYAGSVPDYGPKASERLPPSLPKTTILNRYSLHVVNCLTCSGALRNFRAIELVLHVLPFVLVGLVAASNVKALRGISGFTVPLICSAVLCSLAERWLHKWIKKNYEYHGYNHALVK